MNKTHWNTIDIDGSLNDEFLRNMINHSYALVYKSLPRKTREEFEKKA
jgi:predicted DNA-binding protein (MmcQ/YjbR family)